jgi:alpha-1,3-rhamnosyltransferase
MQSIWQQEYKNVEIIVLDDGSPDNSREVLFSLQKQSPLHMKVLVQPNSGNIAKNFNILTSKAKGKYVIFISCDDKLVLGSISSKIKLMEEDSSLAFVSSSKFYEIDNNNNVVDEKEPKHLTGAVCTKDLLRLEYETLGLFFIQGALFRKEIVDSVGGFDDDLLGDDIVLRTKIFLYMQKHTELSFKVTDDYGFYYREHDNNIHKNSFRQIQLVAQVLERYYAHLPPPDTFAIWIRDAFRKEKTFNDGLKWYFINRKTLEVLLNEKQQKYILRKYIQFKIKSLFTRKK